MATYNFSTITAAQALTISAGDTVVVDGVSANAASVVAAPTSTPTLDVTFGGRTVAFGAGVMGSGEIFVFGDKSELYIGSSVGVAGYDNRTAGPTNDALFGLDGPDNLRGGDGNDVLQGNQGNDRLSGGLGADTVYGGQGDDEIATTAGDTGPNFANGNRGDDTLWSGQGADTLLGGQGDDQLFGQGPNYLSGDLGDDRVFGGQFADTIFGGDGRDALSAGGGDDTAQGGTGADTMWGDAGSDLLDGGEGDDVLLGGTGADVLTGGAGSDLFVFAAGDSPTTGVVDRVTDWTSADRLDLGPAVTGAGQFTAINDPAIDTFQEARDAAAARYADPGQPALAYVAVQVGANVLVFYNEGSDAVQLNGVTTASLSGANFVKWDGFVG